MSQINLIPLIFHMVMAIIRPSKKRVMWIGVSRNMQGCMSMTRKRIFSERVAGVKRRYRNRVLQCRLSAKVAKQKDLSRMTGIPCTTISAIESNKLFLSTPYALLIAEALDCKLDDLFEPWLGSKGKMP
ncbi:MAG: helix-turn-helix transcriptional regulator [candidate division Zixibacteria bacterium]|jgi:DNA-binding XRE family transcriptional regulator|nr:helix-turn-helix transcriptional regulator [candidate division Zixibacteria bacterium]